MGFDAETRHSYGVATGQIACSTEHISSF